MWLIIIASLIVLIIAILAVIITNPTSNQWQDPHIDDKHVKAELIKKKFEKK